MSPRTLLQLGVIAVAACSLLASSCGSDGRIRTAAELADSLKAHGVEWTWSGPLERRGGRPRGVIDEELALEGDQLYLEIFRVEEEKWFKTSAVALIMRAGLEPEDSENALVDAVVHAPFLVAVVEEPEPGQVRTALKRIFPRPDTTGGPGSR